MEWVICEIPTSKPMFYGLPNAADMSPTLSENDKYPQMEKNFHRPEVVKTKLRISWHTTMNLSIHCDVPESRQPKYILELAKQSCLNKFYGDIPPIPVSHFQSSISGW